MMVPPSSGLNTTAARKSFVSTRKSVLAPVSERKSFVSTATNNIGAGATSHRKSTITTTHRKSTVGGSPSAARFTSMKSQNRTTGSFKYTSSRGEYIDDHEYVTGMRYGKIPDRGGAQNPYSESNPHPKAVLNRDRLKPGYREQWLESLESRYSNTTGGISKKKSVSYNTHDMV